MQLTAILHQSGNAFRKLQCGIPKARAFCSRLAAIVKGKGLRHASTDVGQVTIVRLTFANSKAFVYVLFRRLGLSCPKAVLF
jgi:hypothetical protein